ncbi:Cullin-3 [Candida viswanathii]|uniref:Cullin-3 n=1 Tax=Candida viswanathii TaxID=5486 RepID=A0A367Y9P2_9ASCO|nr:Cullin-3 [Candida viswanathii]
MMPPGGRRSKIRPPRKSLIRSSDLSDSSNPNADPTVDFDKNWLILSNAISQIQNKNVSNLSYEQLYRKAYALVLRKHGGKLYEHVTDAIRAHLLARREYLISVSANHELFMQALIQEWNDHLQSMKFISDVLMYLNRVYVKEQKKLLIYDLGIMLFKDHVIKYNDHEIGFKVIDIVINEITKSRLGTVITSSMYITKIINMMELLVESSGSSEYFYGDAYYQIYFEPKFLQSSEESFQTLSNEYISHGLGTKFLQLTTQFIKDEDNRVRFYLPPSTYPKLIDLMNNIMIRDKLDKMILSPNQGLEYWLKPVVSNIFEETNVETYHYADLKLLYNLVGRYDDEEYQLLRLRIKEAIIAQGNSLPEYVRASIDNPANKKPVTMNSAAFATKWIETVLKYRDQLLLVWKNSFDENITIEQTITFALRDFINGSNKRGAAPSVNAPELLSVYMDYYIKQLTKNGSSSKDISLKSGDQTEELISNSIQFLKFIKDKDAFEVHYANHFAKRFLKASNSSSKDIEEIILGSLSEELGTSSFDKVIKMNRDIRLSRDTTSDWKKYIHKQGNPDLLEMDLKICNVTDWPKSMTKDNSNEGLIWPVQLRDTIKEFQEFWRNAKKNDNKSLYWSPKFGSMDLRITYPSRTYDINLSTYAGIIMLLFTPAEGSLAFEENRQYTYLEIQELTGIPELELKRHLQSIAVAPKLRLLVKSPMSKDVKDTDVFSMNKNFKSPSSKVKVLTISSSPARKEEKDEEKEEIKHNRRILISAAIVRIMKSKVKVTHNVLIEELIKQISRFNPLILLIKECIEDLIDKEYIARDLSSSSSCIYNYIA